MTPYLLALRGVDALARHAVAPWGRGVLRRRGVSILHDVAYAKGVQHKLDIYMPPDAARPCPTVFYLHGGGFTALSKASHQMMARAFLAQNVAVVLPDYRLAPEHPFPAALADAATAWRFIAEQAERLGLDKKRVIVAGESAGANLALGLTLSACCDLPHPAVASMHEGAMLPRALMALCGLLQVSDPGRYQRGPDAARPWVQRRLFAIAAAYLGDRWAQFDAARALADPLVMLEGGYGAERPLPPAFIAVGADDPLLADSRRLARAFKARGVSHTWRTYPGAGHAFFAVRSRVRAPEFWRDVGAFLAQATQA